MQGLVFMFKDKTAILKMHNSSGQRINDFCTCWKISKLIQLTFENSYNDGEGGNKMRGWVSLSNSHEMVGVIKNCNEGCKISEKATLPPLL